VSSLGWPIPYGFATLSRAYSIPRVIGQPRLHGINVRIQGGRDGVSVVWVLGLAVGQAYVKSELDVKEEIVNELHTLVRQPHLVVLPLPALPFTSPNQISYICTTSPLQ